MGSEAFSRQEFLELVKTCQDNKTSLTFIKSSLDDVWGKLDSNSHTQPCRYIDKARVQLKILYAIVVPLLVKVIYSMFKE